MSNRHLARTLVMQSLYQWDFNGQPKADKLKEIISYDRAEFAPNFDDSGYVKETIEAIIKNLAAIDAIIVQYAPEWPLAAMTCMDRNILRLGTYELKLSQIVPSKVAINEAIELAKSFGGEASGKFVNGVLGAIYKDVVAKGEMKEVDINPPKKEEGVEGDEEEEVKK
ncbi:MAG: transcription antitermination factor NusB [Candidatus Uhrbacteria bacterium]